MIQELYQHYETDEKKYLSEAMKYAAELEELFLTEKEQPIHEADGSWDVTTLREEIREMYAEMDQDKKNKEE